MFKLAEFIISQRMITKTNRVKSIEQFQGQIFSNFAESNGRSIPDRIILPHRKLIFSYMETFSKMQANFLLS